MKDLRDSQLERLEWHLANATRGHLFQWQWLSRDSMYTVIDDFGIFLEKDSRGLAMRVYCLNVLVLETDRESLDRLFNLALAQLRWRGGLSTDDITNLNLQAPKLVKPRKDLVVLMDKIFD